MAQGNKQVVRAGRRLGITDATRLKDRSKNNMTVTKVAAGHMSGAATRRAPHSRQANHAASNRSTGHKVYSLNVTLHPKLLLADLSKKVSRWYRRHVRKYARLYMRRKVFMRVGYVLVAAVVGWGVFNETFSMGKVVARYQLSPAAELLVGASVPRFADKLQMNAQKQQYLYNDGYTPPSGGVAGGVGGPKFSAAFSVDPLKGVDVKDAVNNVVMTFKPRFALAQPRKDQNRIIYPLTYRDAQVVYSLKAVGFKEDIILNAFQGDKLEFAYELDLPDGAEARIENDGSLGVYGASMFLGKVSAGSSRDEALLQKARERAPKDKVLFRVPAPFITQSGKRHTSARSWFSLKDNELIVHAANLKSATYPLSIDPSIYIETASKLMLGNNESNIDFDVDNELIQKGRTTGARFDEWTSTLTMNEGRWNQGTAVAGGYAYSVGGSKSNTITSSYSSSGSSTYVVPAGVTSVTVKSWGGGAGGGGGGLDRTGGAGGGGGYAQATIAVTPGETLTVRVGGGGAGGLIDAADNYDAGGGGGGGGYSGVLRSATPLVIAAGGGGGGGANGDTGSAARANGTPGGGGGGTSGVAGTGNGTTTGGGAGTQVTFGAAGAGFTPTAGSSLQGGRGGSQNATYGTAAANGGGQGGDATNSFGSRRPGGGGGGAGYFGGGGGGAANARYNGGAGGGGGSSYTTGSGTSNVAASGTTPGNVAGSERFGAADGGAGGAIGQDGSSGDDGRVVVSYDINGGGSEVTSTVYWAKLSTTNNSIESPNPGGGACAGWCTNTAYNLPAARQGLSLVAYNGFLYAIGGTDGTGTRVNTVYIAKLGANGEPQLWHPTDNNKNNWTYWYSNTALSSERSYTAAAAYNNKLYLLGGQTNASAGGVTTVESATISPTGTLGAWSTTGMTALPSARHNHTVHVYNDRIYLIGGNSSGTLQSSVHYAKLNSNGTMNAWNATSSFTTARMAWGGSFTTIWGGYIYLSGGCTALTSGYCSTVASETQLASINADGTIGSWGTVANVINQRMGYGLLSWRNAIYRVGGCKAQDTTSGDCQTVVAESDYGVINQDGDASTVSMSSAVGVGTCTGATPYNCDIPPAGNANGQGGRLASAVVVNNGYIYVVGGCYYMATLADCHSNGSSRSADTVSYASLSADGALSAPAVCTGVNITLVGNWCVDNSHTINGTAGLAAAGYAVFNNTIYVVGGTDGANWQANVWHTSLNSDGSLNTWASQTFANLDLGTARGYMYVFTRANPSAASTYPGNLYVIGGCREAQTTSNGLGCGGYQATTVYKCNIISTGSLEEADANDCSMTNQLQIDAETTAGAQGLGLMAGTIYANYIYLVGGYSASGTDRGEVMYAKIDNNNNIVDADGETVNDDIWTTSPNIVNPVRRRNFAFGYNGYLYAIAGYSGSSSLNDLLFAKIDVSDGSIGVFKESFVEVDSRWDMRAVVSNGYVYTIGGCTVTFYNYGYGPPIECQQMTGAVQVFQLFNNSSGAPASYTASAGTFAAATDRWGASTAVLNRYLYVAGGCISATDCTDATNNVQYAALGADGSIGAWASTTAGLGADRAWGQLEAAGGSLYYIGGQSDTATDERAEVYYATPSSGNISAWTQATNGLPAVRTQHSAAVWNNRIYVTGGLDAAGTAQSTVYVSPQLNSGGNITSAWTSSTGFSVARDGHVAITYANNLYILGGFTGTYYLNDVQYAKIDPTTGGVSGWTYGNSLPQGMRQAEGFAANGFMYLFGGRSAATTCTNNTYVAPISANTTIASGNNPTGVGDWYQTNNEFTGDRYGAAVTYSDGKAYVLGGGCTAPLAANRNSYATLQSQPQVAKYSRMIDTDTDVFPTKWLMNGLDNSVGARWYMKYYSSTDATAAWGQETNFGAVTLGNPENYTPLNGGGADTDFARYYYFGVTIDSSQAYGYPEDVNRGPTIWDLSLFFTADPSKRMRHGKTFTGGIQQPLDTPF